MHSSSLQGFKKVGGNAFFSQRLGGGGGRAGGGGGEENEHGKQTFSSDSFLFPVEIVSVLLGGGFLSPQSLFDAEICCSDSLTV